MARIEQDPEAFRRPVQRRKRKDEVDHLDFIKSLPCLSCALPDLSDSHHLKPACGWAAKPAAGTMRPEDCWTVPLCRGCHDQLHRMGNEESFWGMALYPRSIPFRVALALYAASGDNERGCQIIEANQ